MATGKRVALLAGSTGLVGGYVLRELLASPLYSELVAVTRKEIAASDPKLKQIVGPLEELESAVAEAQVAATDAFCTLGTTIKVAGSQAAFRKVDFDYVVGFARAAKAAGARNFALVTAVGASAESKIFYSRVKGEVEEAVKEIGFDALHIFHPGLLLGSRNESRQGESLMMKLSPFMNPLMIGSAAIYKSIPAETVAAAMIAAVGRDGEGVKTYTYRQMVTLAEG
tara:strand:+ start:255659 stop:256336 length:678 start_codon:yes stop_codon:yes gene_type:complete